MVKNKIIIGSRGSKLAILYAKRAKKNILGNNPDLNNNSIDIKIIKTTGDIYMHSAGKLSFWASELMITEFGNTQEEAIKSSIDTILKMIDF